MRHVRGQATSEFLVCAAVLALALLLPFGGQGSAAERLLEALARFGHNFAFLVALA